MSATFHDDGPTLYEYAGGREALELLAAAQYRRCLTDPILVEVFGSKGRPEHVEHLGDWLTEVLGGPRLYTQRHGGHGALLGHHANLSLQERHRARFVETFLEAADEIGMSPNARFRQRLLEYLDWGSRIAVEVSQPGADTSSDQPVPVWGWGPDGPPEE
ncbi:group II truncated hemoglobin [Humibacter antri]